MKYFLDQEFIEGFHKPIFGKKRHFIDLISIGIVNQYGGKFSAISDEWDFKDANSWVVENVINPLYVRTVHGDARNELSSKNFHKRRYGWPNAHIADKLRDFFRGDDNIEIYGYYADYDWVLFCSLFGTMMDLPKGFPMFCIDLKQMMHEKGVNSSHPDCPKQINEHDALSDAMWNKAVYEWLIKL